MKKKTKKKFDSSKRSIKAFIKDENGFISKGNILKIGLGTVASVGLMSALSKAYGADVYFPRNDTLWVRTTVTVHNNGLQLIDISGTNCSRLAHVNADQPYTHVSTDVNGYGQGCLSGKGCANFNHNGAANGTPPRPY
ncbi:MAG: hypothetical protein JW867_02965 [Candidatus Omnitrophica bacterium]|nr:hypothetical protein [Candidatus Omnitrophota bacterium]